MSIASAAAAWARGDWPGAARICETHLRTRPNDADALLLLGLCCQKLGRSEQGLLLMRRAHALRPSDDQVRRNLGLALYQQGQPLDAARLWSETKRPDPDLKLQIADAWRAGNDEARAFEVLRQCLASNPAEHRAASRLALWHDERNEVDQAKHWAQKTLALKPRDFNALLVLARIQQREGDLDSALQQTETLLEYAASPTNLALVLGLRARLLDAMDQPDAAFEAALSANRLLAETPAYRDSRGSSVYSLAMIRRVDAFFSEQRLARWSAAASGVQETGGPAFLVGFPRSGTTLLDRVLRAHPRVTVIEEKPLLHETLVRFFGRDHDPETIEALDDQQLDDLRLAYLERCAAQTGKIRQGAVVIDKLPLNSIFLGLIWRLFSDARVLFALRDPRDVVLSCFFQTFAANDAMSHFLNLEEAAEYYAAAMALGRRMLDSLPIRSIDVRYESMVQDLEGCARSVLDFLGLEFDPAVLEFRQRLHGERIRTPSFDQVSRPVYTQAAGRWRRYRSQLQPILPGLDPLAIKLGYTAHND